MQILKPQTYRGGVFLKTNEETERHLNIESIYFVGRSSEQLVIDTDTRKDTCKLEKVYCQFILKRHNIIYNKSGYK